MPRRESFRRRFLALSTIMTVAALVLAACGGQGQSGGSADETITIGAYSSATGVLQVYGLDQKRGWELAEADINAAGGINGKKIDIDFQDDASDPTQARSIMSEFVSDSSVVGVMGPTSTANGLASHPLAVAAHVPVISVSNAGNDIVPQGPEVYRIVVPDPVILRPVVEMAVEDFQVEDAAIVYAQDDPFALDSYEAFQKALDDLGVNVKAEIAYSKGTPDLGPQIRKLQDAAPDAAFVAAYSQDSGAFLKQARAEGFDAPVIGNQTFNSPGQLQVAGADVGTLLVGSQWFEGETEPRNMDFVAAFEKAYDANPSVFAAMAYNGAFVVKAALEASNDNTREGLLKGLSSLDGYHVLGSPVTFKDRDAITSEPLALTVENGKFALYKRP